MLNMYFGVTSKENEWQDITGINDIVNIDQNQLWPENRTLVHSYV